MIRTRQSWTTAPEGLEFEAEDVTGCQQVTVTLSARGGEGMPVTAPAGVVARALAAACGCPTTSPGLSATTIAAHFSMNPANR